VSPFQWVEYAMLCPPEKIFGVQPLKMVHSDAFFELIWVVGPKNRKEGAQLPRPPPFTLTAAN